MFAGCVPVPSVQSVIPRASHQAPPEVDRTLYLSDRGTYTKLAASGQVGVGHNSDDMLSVAVKIKFNTATNVKVVTWIHFVCDKIPACCL